MTPQQDLSEAVREAAIRAMREMPLDRLTALLPEYFIAARKTADDVACTSGFTRSDIDELITMASHLRDVQHWAAKASSASLAALAQRLLGALDATEEHAATPWIPVARRKPALIHGRHTWRESNRVLVKLLHDGKIYEEFATYTSMSDPWKVRGHNGHWSEHVTHWMEIPSLA